MFFLFAFEGLSGAGKTTSAKKVISLLQLKGYKAIFVNEADFEPLKSWVNNWRKSQIGDKSFTSGNIKKIAKARSLVHQKIKNKFSKYNFIILDRTVFSGMAYRSSKKCSINMVWKINLMYNILLPIKVFLFMGNVYVCHKRTVLRSKKYGFPFVVEATEQIQKIKEKYQRIIPFMPNVVIIDIEMSLKNKTELIISEILKTTRYRN